MGDFCATKIVTVEIQENGIIRGPDGDIIARLVESASFQDIVEDADD